MVLKFFGLFYFIGKSVNNIECFCEIYLKRRYEKVDIFCMDEYLYSVFGNKILDNEFWVCY